MSVCGVYLQMFMAMSVMGTAFRGYFFAFHLLNIVNNNQLLKGVIQAVTQNGHCCCYSISLVFTARRRASAVYAVVPVCLSQVGVLLKPLNVG